jgi:c-di-GMP-binding flagellar brake protein YcgR
MTQSPTVPQERRRAARAPREWPVEIKNGVGKMWRGTSVDISTAGMRVRIDKALELRGFMFVSFDPGDSVGPFWTRFSLVREVVPSAEYGIRFLDLPPKNVERLQRLVAA